MCTGIYQPTRISFFSWVFWNLKYIYIYMMPCEYKKNNVSLACLEYMYLQRCSHYRYLPVHTFFLNTCHVAKAPLTTLACSMDGAPTCLFSWWIHIRCLDSLKKTPIHACILDVLKKKPNCVTLVKQHEWVYPPWIDLEQLSCEGHINYHDIPIRMSIQYPSPVYVKGIRPWLTEFPLYSEQAVPGGGGAYGPWPPLRCSAITHPGIIVPGGRGASSSLR